jgi:hypothetical protein
MAVAYKNCQEHDVELLETLSVTTGYTGWLPCMVPHADCWACIAEPKDSLVCLSIVKPLKKPDRLDVRHHGGNTRSDPLHGSAAAV